MNAVRRTSWIPAMLIAGLAYLVIGRVFAGPVPNARFWRLAAWVVSGVVFAAHMGYDHFRLRLKARAVALHASAGAALGAFGLAAAAMLHSLPIEHTIRPIWLLSLVLWPAITGVPAYIVALACALVLARLWPRATGE